MAAKVYAEYRNSRGIKRQQLDLKTKSFHIFDGQTIFITKLKQDKAFVCDELEKWKESIINLELEIKKLYHEMEMAIQEKDEVIESLQSKNGDILAFLKTMEIYWPS
jgi:hypothetical protein